VREEHADRAQGRDSEKGQSSQAVKGPRRGAVGGGRPQRKQRVLLFLPAPHCAPPARPTATTAEAAGRSSESTENTDSTDE
jgi:hypothetical protein